MKFSEFELEVENTRDEFEAVLAKCTAYSEASFEEYFNNIEMASLKVESENGSEEDMELLKEAAKEELKNKNENVIKKIWTSCIEAIKKLINSIKNLFAKKDIEKLTKTDKNIKGNFIDAKALKAEEKKFEHVVKKAEAQAKAGKKVSKEELEAAEKEYRKRKKAIIAASVIVPVGVAASFIVSNVLKATEKGDDLKLPEGNFLAGDGSDESVVVCHRYMSKIRFDKWWNNCWLVKKFRAMLQALKGETELSPPPMKKENAEDIEITDNVPESEMDLLDKIIADVQTERVHIVADEYLATMEADLGIPSYKTGISEGFDPESYLYAIESELGLIEESQSQGSRADQKRLDMMKQQTGRQDKLVEKNKNGITKVDETMLKVPMGGNTYYPRYVNGELTVMVEFSKAVGGIKPGTQVDARGYNKSFQSG